MTFPFDSSTELALNFVNRDKQLKNYDLCVTILPPGCFIVCSCFSDLMANALTARAKWKGAKEVSKRGAMKNINQEGLNVSDVGDRQVTADVCISFNHLLMALSLIIPTMTAA